MSEPEFAGSQRFDVRARLGAGGMGVVYRAFDRERNCEVALKTVRAPTPDAIVRFKNEFRQLHDLAHPNLVTLGELYAEQGRWFFTMELVDGQDFVSYVRPGAGTDVARLRSCLRQLARGLAALHAAGKVHRDVKPSNVLVTRDGRLVLLDFGLTTEIAAPLREVAGTTAYMAPEQADAQPAGPEADWYSVGVMLFEALTGRLPFEGEGLRVLLRKQSGDAPQPSALANGVPDDLDQLSVRLLQRDRALRPGGPRILAELEATPDAPPDGEVPAAPAATPFVGRGSELAGLAEAFAATRQARAAAVLVRGESGVGKSALVQHFARGLAAQAGALVLAGRCYERESVPYKAFDGAIDALARHLVGLGGAQVRALAPSDAALLPQVFPALGRVEAFATAAALPVGLDPQEIRRRVFAAVRELLARLADRGPLVLVIDDLQWADADSLAMLSEVLRPSAPALLLLGTQRGESAAVEASLHGTARLLELARLERGDAERLARLLGAPAGSGPVGAAAIADEAGGHPLFIEELVRHGPGAGRLEDALGARIERLQGAERHLLEVIALATEPLAEVTVAAAAGGDGARLARHLAPLRAGKLIKGTVLHGRAALEPFHDRVRVAALERLSGERLRRRHGELAGALEVTRPDPQALAVHWAGAGALERARDYTIVAAERAARALAFHRAAELYRVALSQRESPELRIRLGEALVNAGHGAEAAEVFQTAAAGAPAALALDLRRRAAEQLLVSGHIDAGLAAIARVLEAMGMKLPRSPLAALASALLRRAQLRLRGVGFRERDASQIAPEQLSRIDVCWAVGIGLGMVDHLRGADFQARNLMLSLSAGEPTRVARALALEICYSSTGGSDSEQRTASLIAETWRLARRLGDATVTAQVTCAEGGAGFLEGHWRRALGLLDRGTQLIQEGCTGMTWELDTARHFAASSLAFLGDLGELERRWPILVREAEQRGDRYGATNLRIGHEHLVWLARDATAEGRRDVDDAVRAWSQEGFHIPHYYQLLALGQFDLYEERADDCARRLAARWPALAAALLMRVQVIRVDMRGLRARVALARAQAAGRTQRADLLAAAGRDSARIRTERRPYADALGALLEAGLARLAGRPERALAHLRAAEDGFGRAEMALHAAVARRCRGSLLGGATGAALVSEADGWLARAGVRRPDRLAAALAPGLTGPP